MSSKNSDFQRIDAKDKVQGKALYPGDLNYPNQAFMKILFANRPHAIIKQMDISEAEKMEGVIAVFTAKDVPVNEFGLINPDQPVLCGIGSTKPFADRVRFIGDKVALVVAETEKIAAQAIKRIKIEYEDLPILTNPLESQKPDAFLIHPDQDSNVITHYQIRKGDVEIAFKNADVIVTGEYRTPPQEHAFLQPEAGIGYIDEEGRITVAVAGQWAHEEREQIAASLAVPLEKIRVIHPTIGGAFGGREDISVQIVLALAASKLHERGIDRPVKIIWSREESIIGHFKRHPYFISAKWGATKEGKIIAADVKLVADGGAYISTSNKVLGNATLMCTGPYEIPNVKVDSRAVFTNNIPNGAFRGFGGPQGAFAAEMQMDKIAEKLHLDPVEIRMRNVLKEGSLLSVNSPMPMGVSIPEVIEDCARASAWEKTEMGWKREMDQNIPIPAKPHIRKGIGFACAFKNVGFSFGSAEQSTAKVELFGESEIERVVLYHGGSDVGQGSHTVFAQIASEALNISPEKIKIISADTALTENAGSASASRMTFMAGNSIIGAARMALEKWNLEERPASATFTYIPPKTSPYDAQTGECTPSFAYGYVAESAEVEVDIETGEIRILKIVCSDDVGKAINTKQLEGQIEGGVVQGAGYAVLENLIERGGDVLTRNFSTYLIPTVLDIPGQVESRILEFSNQIGPFGARGMGEMPLLPVAPAIIAAVHSATGVWFDEFPLTPDRVLSKLQGIK
jgi:CO/xanthine dehydrogenase Mo-binding subunit